MAESLIYDVTCGNWIKNPTGSQIELAFASAISNGGSSIDDIIIKWRTEDGSDWSDLHIAVASNEESCFVARITKESGVFELLAWGSPAAHTEPTFLLDHGGGEWRFLKHHQAPISEIKALAKEFSRSGRTDQYIWETEIQSAL